LMFNLGVQRTSAILGSLLLNTNPMFVPLLAVLLIKEKFIFRKFLYIIIGCVGLVILSLGGGLNVTRASNYLIGIGFVLVGSISVAINTVLSEKLVKKYSGLTIGSYFMFIGALCLLLHTLVTGELFQLPNFSAVQILPSVYIGAFPTAITWLLFLSSMKTLSSSEAAVFKLLIPLFSAVFAIIFLKEILTLSLIIGGTIIIAEEFE
jgi:drug/metabolite transporter (DMT)-like permease